MAQNNVVPEACDCAKKWVTIGLKDIAKVTLDILLQDIVNDRVDVLIHILEEEREAVLDGQLQLLQEVWVVKGANLNTENNAWCRVLV